MERYHFKDRTLSISKQINGRYCFAKNWRFSIPKTKSSIRILKMSQVITNGLKMVEKEAEKISRFNDNFFVAEDCFLYVAIHLLTIKMLTAN